MATLPSLHSGRLLDYLGSGLIADRPVTLNLFPQSLGVYFSTDEELMYFWEGNVGPWKNSTGFTPVSNWGNILGTLSNQTDLQDALDEKVDKEVDKGLSTNDFTGELLMKLNEIEAMATRNQTDAYLVARVNHTGVQAIDTVTGLSAALDGKETPAGALAQMQSYGFGVIDSNGPNSPDLDAINTASGIYRVSTGTAGTKPLGAPSTTTVEEIRYNATNVRQLMHGAGTTDAAQQSWSRNKSGASLTPWKQFAFLDSPVFTGTPTTPNLKLGNVASADVNTLDYYEEGTFTPTLVGLTTPGAPTYTVNSGLYTRTGNRVCFSLRLAISAKGGMVGGLRIASLPFTVRNSTASRSPCSMSNMAGMVAGINSLYSACLSGVPQLELAKFLSAATATVGLLDTDIADNFSIYISGQYEV